MYSNIIQNLLVPIYDIAKMTSRYKYGRILANTQYLPQEEILRLQNRNLRDLIDHAYSTVPYYNRMFKERGLKPLDIKTVHDLDKLPILTKTDIRKNFLDLISKEYPVDQLIAYKTGGTGSPLKFYITRDKISWEVAAEYRAYKWAGYRLGDRCFMFWGSPIDLHEDPRRYLQIANKITHSLERVVSVDPWNMSDSSLKVFALMLNKFEPKIIRGYTGSLYIMAKYLLENRTLNVNPKAVITQAETLFAPMRKTIEEAFGCPVFDFYGSREVGAIAAECEEHKGYHITAENVALEYVRKGENVSFSQSGAILVTALRNFGMPLIRYAIGDVGKPSRKTCGCGRGLPLMQSIEGRASQFLGAFDKKAGKIVPIDVSTLMDYIIIHLKSPPENIRIIQRSLRHIIIKIVKRKGFLKEDLDFLFRELRTYLGNDIKIEVQFVSTLPPLPSGKRSTLISKIDVF